MQLREYQTELIEGIRRSIRQGHKRIIVQLYVGGGKTVIASEIMRSATKKYKRSIFLAPRRQLVYQTNETLQRFSLNTGIIMAGEKAFNQPLVQVGSFDTIISRVKSGRMKIPEASLVIADECHATFSKNRLDLLANYPLVIGLTSTPALANGKGMGAFYTDIVHGPTMREMVENNYLVPMRYYGADAPDLTKVGLNKDGDYVEGQLAEATDKPELIGSIYDNYRRIAGDRTTLIFAVNCAHARHIHDEFKNHGIVVEYIDGSTPTEDREAIKKRVETRKTRVIVNIGVMSFGTDWPIISCVIVARVTRNISSWIQMVGRGSRLHPDKTDCIVIYHGDNFEELGRIDDPITWSLDDKTTVKERKEKARKETQEPKDIKCKCGYVFRGSRICPSCGESLIGKSEAIPFHQAELKELVKTEKFSSEYKERFYQELLGYCRRNSKADGYAFHLYIDKFKIQPAWKKIAIEPSQETIGFIKHRQIAKAKAAA